MSAKTPTPSEEIKENIRTAYARWNVPEKFLDDATITTPEILIELLSAVEKLIPEMGCRIIPTSFDANEPSLQAFPQPVDSRWTSCERPLRNANSKGVIMRLPTYWQIGLPLHAACRSVGIPIFVNEPENIPVGAMALKTGGIDTVVSENRDAEAFAEYLVKHALPYPRLGIVVHRIGDMGDVSRVVLDTWGTVAQEVHVFPGVPVLDQCLILSEKKEPRFHLSDAYFYELSTQGTLITSVGGDPFPLYRYKLSCLLEKSGDCSCGKPVFERRI